MGIFDDIIKGINTITEYKKADAEQIKVRNQKNKIRKINRENKELKKTLSKSNKVSIIGITVTVLGVIVGIIFWYYPIYNIP
jgi:cell division protein FtsL